MQHIQPNTLLQGGKYKIERVLGQGGFGITYLAIQGGLERKVAVKEFFMKELCDRDENTSHVTLGTTGSRETVNRFREKFLKEARNIAKLNHPNIVRVIDVFEENDTAYYVMEYAANGTLADKVKREGCLSETVATRYILQVAEALNYIHQQKMNHLDIKPGNVVLTDDGHCVLIDFGLSKQYDAGGRQTSTTPVGISEGYAPMEQYTGAIHEFSPETDIYSLGATFYNLLTGEKPPIASEIYENGVPVNKLQLKNVSQRAVDVICKAMEPRKCDRIHDVQELINALTVESETTAEDESTQIVNNAAKEAYRMSHMEVPKNIANDSITHIHNSENLIRKWLWTFLGVAACAAMYLCFRSFGNMDAGTNNSVEQSSNEISYSNGVLTVKGISYSMISVEGGIYMMGATPEIKDPAVNEKPVHRVSLKPFAIGKTEVTQALWNAVMERNPSTFIGDNLPVDNVSWNDCQEFIVKINKATGKKFRLPTEEEWEYAARGGNKSELSEYSGSNDVYEIAWYDGNSEGTSHQVALKLPNELGIYDMSGNVAEWCNDIMRDYGNPDEEIDRFYCRVFRGGSWMQIAQLAKVSSRLGAGPDDVSENFIGFRLALSE